MPAQWRTAPGGGRDGGLRRAVGTGNSLRMAKIRLGTRGSRLALRQAEQAAAALRAREPGLDIEIAVIRTTGDRILDRRLADIGGKGLFAKEIEVALADGRIDAAVHSVKDLETVLPEGFVLAAMLERADPRDGLAGGARTLAELPPGARVGTASLRRQAQMLARRPDLVPALIRGNVDTRLERVRAGEFDATFLAMAGLARLGMAESAVPIAPEDMLPAAGQGAVGVECRAEDAAMCGRLAAIDHAPTSCCVSAERALLAALDGSCRTPIAAYARLLNGELVLRGRLLTPDGAEMWEVCRSGPAGNARTIGLEAGEALRVDAPPGALDA